MVRALDPENRVIEQKLVVVGEAENGLWVEGLPSAVNLITVGQNYVSKGETVEVFPANNL
jgi:multidrug efflux system membrane fusion protein